MLKWFINPLYGLKKKEKSNEDETKEFMAIKLSDNCRNMQYTPIESKISFENDETKVCILSSYEASSYQEAQHGNENIKTILSTLTKESKLQSQKQKEMLSSYMLSAYSFYKIETETPMQTASILGNDNANRKVKILFGTD